MTVWQCLPEIRGRKERKGIVFSMQVRVYPSVPNGAVTVPPSKSLAHRAIICACLAQGESRLENIAQSKDIAATIRCMRALGARITEGENSLVIQGVSYPRAEGSLLLDCGESGSTLRFLIPLFSLTGKGVVFTGGGLLMERPQSVYEDLFLERRLAFSRRRGEIALRGALCPGQYRLRGDVSSQFITGLLFTLPLLDGDSEIVIEPPFESRSYVELTLEALERFSVHVEFSGEHTLKIPGNQRYRPCETRIEGDYSQAAFFGVLGAVGGQVDVRGLYSGTKQGDAVILELLRRFGAEARPLAAQSSSLAGYSFLKGTLRGREADLADCPDLGPVLTVLGACAEGETLLKNAGRLRIKECDRAAAMERELTALGAEIRVEGDTIRIWGGQRKESGEKTVQAHNDHRIAMSLAVYAACGKAPVVIDGAECVSKSYPNFFQDLQAAGVRVEFLAAAEDRETAEMFPEKKQLSTLADRRFLIVGLGLIGGCYAMGLSRLGCTVTAIDVNEDSIAYGKEAGLIADGGTTQADTERLVKAADVIVMGLYPKKMADWVLEQQDLFQPGTLLTDVSGVKRAVLYRIQEGLRPDVEFIGSHPMAGRELSGVRNSDDRIFRDANFIVTPTGRNTVGAVTFAKELGGALGFGRISVISPEEHDRMVGYLSQLTHAIAVSLMNASDNPHLVEYTGDSFRDLTRIARINEALWSELFFLNKDMLIPEIDSFVAALEDLKEKLSSGDQKGLEQLFIQSTERRKRFDRPDKA